MCLIMSTVDSRTAMDSGYIRILKSQFDKYSKLIESSMEKVCDEFASPCWTLILSF